MTVKTNRAVAREGPKARFSDTRATAGGDDQLLRTAVKAPKTAW